ncbi:hypothetical protein WKR88_27200 [Trinickia caryophylli]|uniref:Uncharacterized protein n=1 Tax=Trinickia caryophylli TaxID=28094 RepID=A0A1X7EWF6_TRICW|nr:hypothetical protein [Trinickia caryophylli]PMS09697.1 hypothetical protein C0Z17_23770 [Trinickia caryophylli]TRX18468.1 hypothetical protein FNF07_09730 [Trinickia caryophylli]WQE10745.1 hypothetical protein U0034_13200 [Trinickia caryophylli]SMF41322.1 hypothetical protein SAMN06295900_106377 [Trinickia caryophylli]GLU33120.1 hypothetical protein Busp01_29620 [Trinickia caryophylli]
MPFSPPVGRAAARIAGISRDNGNDSDRDRPADDQARGFRALFERAQPPAAPDDAHGGHAFGQPMRESIEDALACALAGEQTARPGLSSRGAASPDAGADALKVRLTNGPLAGSEFEVRRQGGQLAIDVRLTPRFAARGGANALDAPNARYAPFAPFAPDESDARRRAMRLAADLAAKLNASVSVEYLDDRPAQT